MLNICIGPSRKRIQLDCSRFYTHTELFRITREQSRNSTTWFEYGPNLYQPINTDQELRFVCNIIEGDIDSFMSDEDREQNRRDLSETAHTHQYENSLRGRRPRVSPKLPNTSRDHSRHKRESVIEEQDTDTMQYKHTPDVAVIDVTVSDTTDLSGSVGWNL
jgi:hypothetical protein